MVKQSKTIGLVLSGGGFKGVAHIGAIKALEEAGISPQVISGTSAGSLVGALYAGGYDIQEIQKFFKQTSLFKINRFARKKAGFLDSEKFVDDLITYFPDNSFESLQKKLFVTTTNLVEGSVKVFSKGQLIRPILASAAFPGVFSPIKIDGQLYADGGILDNFPVEPLTAICDMIIGVDVTAIKKPKISDFKHSYNVMQRAYYLRAIPNSHAKFNYCDLIIHPEGLANHALFSNANLDKVFNHGYQKTKEQVELFFKKKGKEAQT